MIEAFLVQEVVTRALAEDLRQGDCTTDALFPDAIDADAAVIAKEPLVVTGMDLFRVVFHTLDPTLHLEIIRSDGQWAQQGEAIARLRGNGRTILKGERTGLNFLQHLSGIATLTRRFVERIQPSSAKIVDTRKTTPGLRIFEKEAVRLGGGGNHRHHLGDLILIKDNHIALAGGVGKAIARVRSDPPHTLKVEVEVKRLDEVKEALSAGVDIIMLDNMSPVEIETAVALIRRTNPSILIEVSGGVDLEGLTSIAQKGVDIISVGALTHSASAANISLNII
ncbi:MAG: carboxylating nicotinate-nucleotide diphosphorylase [Nitrospiria bacterium]